MDLRARRSARPPSWSRLRAGLSLLGLGLVFGGSSVAWSAAMQAQSASATTLPPSSLPLHNATADPATGCPDGGAYWHFVLTPNNSGSSFVSIVLNVGGTTYPFTGFPPIVPNGSQTDNVFVPVPTGHVVTDLEIDGSYAVYAGGSPSQFVLSGVCAGNGDGTTTTTAAPTTTTAAPTTTTAAPTTTTSCDSEECDTTTTISSPSTTVLPSCIGTCNAQPTSTTAPPTTESPSTAVSAAVLPAAVTPSTSSPVIAPAQLATTGARTGPFVATGIGLIVVGIVALALGNRRTRSRSER